MESGKIRVSVSINNAVQKMNDAAKKIGEIRANLVNVNRLLMDEKWSGYSNEKTRDINRLLKMYNNSIQVHVTDMKAVIKTLDTNAKTFESESNKI